MPVPAIDVRSFCMPKRAETSYLDCRRATSHNSYVHKRRPNLKLQQARATAKVSL